MFQNNLEVDADHMAARLWQELTRAPHDRHHDWRTPTLATQGIDQNGPQARTVVLRHADAALWTLRVFTDARSPKCLELKAQPFAAWERVKQSPASADYLSALPPGHLQSASDSKMENSEDSGGEHHFVILNFQVQSMDWLALGKKGHQRARLTPAGSFEWLVP